MSLELSNRTDPPKHAIVSVEHVAGVDRDVDMTFHRHDLPVRNLAVPEMSRTSCSIV